MTCEQTVVTFTNTLHGFDFDILFIRLDYNFTSSRYTKYNLVKDAKNQIYFIIYSMKQF